MRNRVPLIVALLFATAVVAGGIAIDPGVRGEVAVCPASGGDGGSDFSTKVVAGTYLFRVWGEDTSICFHDYLSATPTGCSGDGYTDGGTDGGGCWTCASGGEKFPVGFGLNETIRAAGRAFSCRSAGGTGGFALTHSY